jgi:hypothetical protein
MSTRPAHTTPPDPAGLWRGLQAGAAGALISLAPALTMGLLAFAAMGLQAAAPGIPAALVSSAVGGAVFALLACGSMAAGGPGAVPVLVLMLVSLLPQVVLGGVMVTIAARMADHWSLQLPAQNL